MGDGVRGCEGAWAWGWVLEVVRCGCGMGVALVSIGEVLWGVQVEVLAGFVMGWLGEVGRRLKGGV